MEVLKAQALKILLSMMLTAKANLEGQKGTELEKWVTDRVLAGVEENDNLIPMLKAFVDEPWVDQLEAAAVKQGAAKGRELVLFAIRKAYAYAVANGIITAPVEKTPAEMDKSVLDSLGLSEDDVNRLNIPDSHVTARAKPAPLYEAGQDAFGNKQDQHGNPLEGTGNAEPTPTVAAEPTRTPPPEDAEPEQPETPPVDDDKQIAAYLQANHNKGGGWYEFESADEKVAPHRVQGKDAAKAYLLDTPEFADKYNASKPTN